MMIKSTYKSSIFVTAVTMLLFFLSGQTKAKESVMLNSEFGMELSWNLKEEAGKAAKVYFEFSTDYPTFHWISLGFHSEKLDDVFLLWFDKRKRLHHKDCYLDNTVENSIIHLDKQQDYFVTRKKRHRNKFHVAFHRQLNTDDPYDVELKAGAMSVVLSFGDASVLKTISNEYRKGKSITSITIKPLENIETSPSPSLSTIKTIRKSTEAATKPRNVLTKTKSTGAMPTQKYVSTVTTGTFSTHGTVKVTQKPRNVVKSSGQPAVVSMKKEQEIKVHIATTHVTTEARKRRPVTKPVNIQIPPDQTQNCTGKTNTWEEVIRMRGNSTYYAIIGSAALLTGMIVLVLACCCSKRKVMVSPRQKMAFYKVDDYDDDDEQVEFLREREEKPSQRFS